jgi:hypothetical protein
VICAPISHGPRRATPRKIPPMSNPPSLQLSFFRIRTRSPVATEKKCSGAPAHVENAR